MSVIRKVTSKNDRDSVTGAIARMKEQALEQASKASVQARQAGHLNDKIVGETVNIDKVDGRLQKLTGKVTRI